jgi:polar amino acid transport system permease protein
MRTDAPDAPPAELIRAVPARHPLRWAAAIVIAVLAAMLAHMLVTNPNFGWDSVARYLTDPRILAGVAATIELTAAAMAAGIAGGLVLALMRLSRSPLLPAVSGAYTWFFRGTPVLVQLLFWYNIQALTGGISLGIPFGPALATVNTNQLITTYVAAVLGLGLNEAAYMSEIIRAGILSVDPGQADAARTLGMRRRQVMRRIVLPQAMRVIIPPTGNETISMLKATSLVSVIAVTELLKATQDISSVNYQVIPLLMVASIWYLIMTSVLSVAQHYIERHYGRGHAAAAPPASRMPWLRRRTTGQPTWPPPASPGDGHP